MIFIILGLCCLTNLLIVASPIAAIKDKFGLLNKEDSYSIYRNLAIELLNCALCLGFWVGVIYFCFYSKTENGILYAAIVSVMSEFINRKLS